jgi:starch-binding outer membrane protein, SusD/RagB family
MLTIMNKYIKNIVPAAALALSMGMTSCTGDLDVTPIDPNLDLEYSAEGLFNKCYATLALAGNGGANGDCDIDGLDGGTTGFVRQLVNSNDLTTDEAICGWGDEGISDYCFNTYGSGHPMLKGFYSRLTTAVSYCNQYLSVAGDNDATMAAEVRFLRAYEYSLIMDGWGCIPFSTKPLATPTQMSREEAFNWIEQELLDIIPSLNDAKAKKSTDANYGRVDKAAAWLLLSRLYLNAEVYTGTAQWAKAAEYAKKVMDSDYRLNTTSANQWSAYQMLFMGDNGETDAAYEAIFPLLQDGVKSTAWGTSLYLIAGCYDSDTPSNVDEPTATNNTNQAWGGLRCRPDLLKKFDITDAEKFQVHCWDMVDATGDDRALFDGVGRKYDNEDTGVFKNGFATTKFSNWYSTNESAHDSQYADTDFFLMRAAEAYLTYAEALARQNGGTATGEAATAINAIRNRAHAQTKTSYTLDEILDEWSREFYFEGRRRVDLIRYGYYGGNANYNWTWKGGSKAGVNFASTRNIFAIPASVITANGFTQNPGY